MTIPPAQRPSHAACCDPDVLRERVACAGQPPVTLEIRRRPRSRHRAPVVLHLHGGAFTCGSAATTSMFATALFEAGATVISVDYPLAPAHPYPQAVEASYAALQWAGQQRATLTGYRSPLLVAGEEAGGTLAAAIALMARDRLQPKLSGMILLSPMLDPCVGTPSLRHSKAGPVGCKWADGWSRYLQNPGDADHPYAVPALASRQSGLPSTLLVTAQDDPLRDEALSYAARLRGAGVAVDEAVLPAPTGWPETLAQSASQTPWRQTLQQRLQLFLGAACAPTGCR